MTTQQQHEFLQKHFGRVPEHYTLYPLPDERRGGPKYSNYGMTMEDGRVYFFEFDFCVYTIPQDELESLIPHDCGTCHWAFMKDEPEEERKLFCPLPPDDPGTGCAGWEISRSATRIAEAEYYKRLHEKHYGKISVSV